jgi:serine/threonine-protein kinase
MDNHNLPLNFQLNNKYNIKKVLGQGGFGITYLAQDTFLDIEVCIKELFVSGSSTRGANMTVITQNLREFSFADFKDRFIQEARQLAKFKHPNIVRVQDFFEANNTAYVVMEFVEGQTLKDKVAFGGPLSADASHKIIESILDAVEVVHKAGMLHRDIKPDNLIIGNDGRVVLIDFGSARNYSDERTIAQTAMVSPGYAPLEQYNPTDRKGAFTDIYSIGATFYFMLTGEKPLNVTNRYSERLKAPHEINPNVSMQVSSAVMLAMEMKAEDRFQNVADFRIALKQLERQKKDESNEEKIEVLKPTQEPKPKENKSKRLPKVLLAIGLLLLVSIFVIYINTGTKSEICACADTLLSMTKEVKEAKMDMEKMKAIEEKYKAGMDKCNKLGEGKSDEEQKKMREELENCPSYKELEKIQKEMMGGE